MHRTIAFLLLISSFSRLCAQSVVISGTAADYPGKEISFYTYSDPVVHQKQELGTVNIGTDGSFSITLSVNQVMEIYTDLEKYTGTLVAEPGKNYIVTLPPFSQRTADEARSPYFKPSLYWLGLPKTPSGDLNFMVRSFITEYNLETVKNSAAIYQNSSKTVVNEMINRLEEKFPDGKSDYFRMLKDYTFAELEYIVSQRNSSLVINKYFAHQSLGLNNPAYQRCFGSIFSDFLRKEAQDYKNKKITALVNSANFPALVSYFESKGYRKDFAELVVLKGLYDGYYTGGFDKKSILSTLKQSQSSISAVLLMPVIEHIINKLESLSVGSKAPSFNLINRMNQNITPEAYRGRFIYLNFIRSSSPESCRELDSIVPIEKKFGQVLSVVSITTDENFDIAIKLWKDKNYHWELLNGSGNKKLIENYKAEVVPAFYLISPDGTLLLSPALPPTHEFEALFLKLIRDYNFKQGGKVAKPK